MKNVRNSRTQLWRQQNFDGDALIFSGALHLRRRFILLIIDLKILETDSGTNKIEDAQNDY